MQLSELYPRYLAAVNRRDWTAVAGHVASSALVNGRRLERERYIDDLRALTTAHADHHWKIVDLIASTERLAVRLETSSADEHGFELAHYRWSDNQIVEVWSIGSQNP